MAKVKGKDSKQTKQKSSVAIPEENKYVSFGLLGIFLVLVFMAASYKISGDDDIFWHLATGRYIVEHKVVPDKDVFGHITSGSEWIPFEWGWDVMTYGLYNIGGLNAILLFRSLAFCFIFFVLYMLLRKFKINSFLSIAVLFVLLVAIMDRFSARPHILTYIFFVLLLYILLSYKYIDRQGFTRKLYFIPVIFLLWANSHMGVLAGGLILFVFTVTETIIYLKPGKFSSGEIKTLNKTELRNLWIISAASALMLLVNPHGFSTYVYAYDHTQMKMLESVNEWQSPFSPKMDFGFIITLYKVFMFAGIFILYYAYKKKDLLFALIYLSFVIYSVRAIRFTVDYEIIIAVFVIISLSYTLSLIRSTDFRKLYNGNVLKGILAIFFVYIVSQIPSNAIYEKIQYYRIYGWGINTDFMPEQLFNFKKENNITGTPYNHFGTGGYLVWNFPGEKNYIDSRNLNDEIHNEYDAIMVMQPGFEKKLEERGVDYVIYLDPDLIRRPNDLKRLVTNYFSTNKKWKLVFWDDKSMLFVKDVPKFSEVIQKYEYKVLDPYDALFNRADFESNVKQNPDAVKLEVKRKLDTEPNGFLFQTLNQAVNKIMQGL
ncbi:MAG TPA: hypothetical protein PK605_00685 [Ignavibacteria bacterium]|nr:hypothetical protein [Ignavibacteria bacterium]HRF66055.1 hypothetical protein [Ignavibacteria bacterium]HRJ02895.1 hypothetical protein [Ignavibacteria bacterium]